ncbi:MAG: hypothetical protein ABUS57_07325 [Pseudomonadota bacterium]
MKHRILAHRGFWTTPIEKNSREAILRAFDQGYGIETDVRDLDGALVISHDPPRRSGDLMDIGAFLDLYRRAGTDGWLALNIKADGLAEPLKRALAAAEVTRYFVFDMSVPDHRMQLRAGLMSFTRRSDIEPAPALYEASAGVWLDAFDISHAPAAWVAETLRDGKAAALVSPELHGRPHQTAWAEWRAALDLAKNEAVMLCTDLPDQALAFFADGP